MTDPSTNEGPTEMPQPLSRVKKISHLLLGPGTLDKHPAFSEVIAKVISCWSYTEYAQAEMLAFFIKSDLPTSYAMYFALQNPDPRRKLLKAAATAALDGSDQSTLKTFELIDRAIGSVRNQRNSFAHGLWMWSEQLPEALLLVDVDTHVLNRHVRTGVTITPAGKIEIDSFGAKNILVYRKKDFARALTDAESAYSVVKRFNMFLGCKGSPTGDVLHAKILAEPLVATLKTPQTHRGNGS